MKKKIYMFLVTILSVYMLAGCGSKDKMNDFIPTLAPEAEDTVNDNYTEDSADNMDQGSEDIAEDGEKDVIEGGAGDIKEEGAGDIKEEGAGAGTTPTKEPVPVGQTTTKYVKLKEYSDYLNIRSTPSVNGKIQGLLVHTEKVSVVDIVDGWASIVYDGQILYVKAEYLVDERPEFLEPPTPTPENTSTPAPVANEEPADS